MKRSNGFRVPTIAVVAAVVTLMIGLSMAFAATGGKHPSNPWAGLSDQQKQAQVDAAHAANIKYLQDFEARHGDPRSLPVIKVATYAPPPASLGAAAAQASLIIGGRVTSVHFIADPAGGMPQTKVTLTVARVGKGSAATTLVVYQNGGPVAQPNGKGALVELEYENLMLPNDEVILLLSRVSADAGYQPVYGAGVQLIQNGRMTGDTAGRYGVSGKSDQVIWDSLTDPTLSVSAYPVLNTPG